MLDEYYSYSEFTFKRDQILWALRYAELMIDGKWPPEPLNTGYTDPGIRRKGVKREPEFVKPAVIIAEIDKRIELTNLEGKLLMAEVDADYERFSDEAWMALNFITGWKRKKDYVNWKKQRRSRLNKNLTKTQIQERAKRKRNSRR